MGTACPPTAAGTVPHVELALYVPLVEVVVELVVKTVGVVLVVTGEVHQLDGRENDPPSVDPTVNHVAGHSFFFAIYHSRAYFDFGR